MHLPLILRAKEKKTDAINLEKNIVRFVDKSHSWEPISLQVSQRL